MITAYQLSFTSPAHFGLEGIGQERVEQLVRSDTLWGALVQKWLLLYDDDPDLLCQETTFKVSSCFPFIQGQLYFPVPAGTLDKVMDDVAHMETGHLPFDLKDLKKIRYFAEPLFRKVISGGTPTLADINEATVYPSPVIHSESAGLEASIFSLEMQRPRVALNQMLGGVREGAFFYCTDQFFDTDSGLFFLATFTASEIQTRFEAALRLLGDCGLGADRSIGRGCFSFTSTPMDFQTSSKGSSYVLLSLYHPARDEVEQGIMSSEKSAYTLVRRSGYAASHMVGRFRRADCWMLTEGARLPFAPVGQTPCVLAKSEHIPHNVYRYGKAFCLPLAGGDV